MKIILIIPILALHLALNGQNNFWKEVPLVLQNMEDTKHYSVIINYAMYLDGNFFKPFQTKSVELNRDGDKVNMKQEGVFEIIETPKLSLNINHRDKRIIYVKQDEKEITNEEPDSFDMEDMYQFFVVNKDNAAMFVSDIKLVSQKPGLKEYEVFFKEGEYTKVLFAIDAPRKELKYVMVHYREKQMIGRDTERPRELCMKIEYKNYTTNPVFNPSRFSVSRFLHTNNKTREPELNSTINHYKLVVY